MPLKDVTVKEEETVTLQCELSKPNQKVKWFKNGKELKPDKKRGIEPKVDGMKHTLTIPKSILDDTAEYSVRIGDQETKGKVTVEGKKISLVSMTKMKCGDYGWPSVKLIIFLVQMYGLIFYTVQSH